MRAFPLKDNSIDYEQCLISKADEPCHTQFLKTNNNESKVKRKPAFLVNLPYQSLWNKDKPLAFACVQFQQNRWVLHLLCAPLQQREYWAPAKQLYSDVLFTVGILWILIVSFKRFSTECRKPKYFPWPIPTDVNNTMHQSECEANTSNRRKARENAC